MPALYDFVCDTCASILAKHTLCGELFGIDRHGVRHYATYAHHPLEARYLYPIVASPFYRSAAEFDMALGEEAFRVRGGEQRGWLHRQVAARLGFASHCLCPNCLSLCLLDLGDDEEIEKTRWEYRQAVGKGRRGLDTRLCCSCGGGRVRSLEELVGKRCLRCERGYVRKRKVGRR
jgi:hypothetical protein